MTLYEQYQICKERKHVVDEYQGGVTNAVFGAVPKYTCKYCKTVFWTTTEVTQHEANAPTPPINNIDKDSKADV